MLGLRRALTVLFDLDGTLVEYNIKGEQAKKEFLYYISDLGYPVKEIDPALPLGLIIKLLSKNSEERAKELLSTANRVYKKYEIEAAKFTRTKEFAIETLMSLKDKKINVGVTTNNSKEAVMLSLRKSKLLEYIDVIVTRDDVIEIKPFPEMLIKAAHLLKAPLNMCMHVGDSYVDVMAARSSGMMAVAVVGGVSPIETLYKYQPHFIINNLRELLTLIDDY